MITLNFNQIRSLNAVFWFLTYFCFFQPFEAWSADFQFKEQGSWPGYSRGYAQSVRVLGNYAYVTIHSSNGLRTGTELLVFDVSDPTTPVRVGQYDRNGPLDDSADLADLSGSYVFLVEHLSGRLNVIDVADPSRPTLTSSLYPFAPSSRGVQTVGRYCYALSNSAFIITDISDPKTPTFVGHYDVEGNLRFFVDNTIAYLIGGSRMQVLDLSKPAAPTLRKTYWDASGGFMADIKVIDRFAYVAFFDDEYGSLQFGGGLRIFDVINPDNPVIVGRYDTHSSSAARVWVEGRYAFFYDALPTPAIHILDVSDVKKPTQVSQLAVPGRGNVYDLQASGNFLYITANFPDFWIVDISNPLRPITVGGFQTRATSVDLQVQDNFVYLTDAYAGIQLIDVQNAAHPIKIVTVEGQEDAYRSQLIGTYEYVANLSRGLEIIDVSTPGAPKRIGGFNSGGGISNVEVVGKYAYLTYQTNWFQIVDVSDPMDPKQAGGLFLDGIPATVRVSGKYAYVGFGRYAGIKVIDIGTPESPSVIGDAVFGSNGSLQRIALDGNFAYLALGYGGLQIADLKNPTKPIGIGNFQTNGTINDVFVDGEHLFVAGSLGIQVFDKTNPLALKRLGVIDSGDEAFGVKVANSRIFVANGSSGLKSFDIIFLDDIGFNVRATGDMLQFSWLASGSAFRLQNTTSLLDPSHWVDERETPTLVGNEYQVLVAAPSTNRFFRLIKQ